jgi:hypothetical protein
MQRLVAVVRFLVSNAWTLPMVMPFVVVGGALVGFGLSMVWVSLDRAYGLVYFSPLLAMGVLLWGMALLVAELLRKSNPR